MSEQELRDKLEMIYIKLLDIEEKQRKYEMDMEKKKAEYDKKENERVLLDLAERSRFAYEIRKEELSRFNKLPYLHVEGE